MNICLKQLENNMYEMIIADDGIGIDESEIDNEEKLGLMLVRSLAEDQLNGELNLDNTKGTRWSVKFNIN
jgi:two-component sensor histidine kinase